jgi:hypothetical protein
MDAEEGIDRDMRGGSQLRRGWGRVARLAERQHGVVSREQLLALGLSSDRIDRQLAARRMHPLHLGVYAVGHRNLTRHGRWSAAVLAGGPGAVLSHRSAAQLWQLLDPTASQPSVTTAVKGRRRPGVRFHYSPLPTDEVATRHEIPTTTVARTLLDLAAVLPRDRLERALAQAEYRRYPDSPSLHDLLERHAGRRGLATLRGLLASADYGRGITRSPWRTVSCASWTATGCAVLSSMHRSRSAPRPSTSTASGEPSGSPWSSTGAPRTCGSEPSSPIGFATGN